MADMDFFELLATIAERYPQFMPFLQQPGVFKVLADSVNGTWSDTQTQAALQNTEYFKSTPLAVRQWHALQYTDPATASQKATDTKSVLDDLIRQTGVHLDTSGGFGSMYFQFFVQAVSNGWDAQTIKYKLLASTNATATGGGDIGETAVQVRKLANDYGIPMSDATVMDYARRIVQGVDTPDSIKGDVVKQAMSLYPSMNDQLSRGYSVRDVAQPYLQLAQQELGIDPNTVNLTDKKWMALLNQRDPKTGVNTTMPLDQALATMRTDPIYGYDSTAQGRQAATQLTGALAQKFGAMG